MSKTKSLSKDQIIQKANTILKRGIASLKKDLETLLAGNKVWYNDGDLIKSYPDLRRPDDHNAEQFLIDNFNDMIVGLGGADKTTLWREKDFAEEGK